jgi:hypothetical protein
MRRAPMQGRGWDAMSIADRSAVEPAHPMAGLPLPWCGTRPPGRATRRLRVGERVWAAARTIRKVVDGMTDAEMEAEAERLRSLRLAAMPRLN